MPSKIDKALKDALIPDATKLDLTGEEGWTAVVEEKANLDRIKRYVEKRLEEIKEEGTIEIALIGEDVEAVRYKGWVVKRSSGRSADTISAARLLELGVPAETIQAATVPGKPYTYAQIVVPKDVARPITTWAELEASLPEGAR